jgi:hypothetical protein
MVWEPILPSDWQRPTSQLLSRVSDVRVSQFWDKDHLVSRVLKEHISRNEPNCCEDGGVLWDLIAIYPGKSVLRSTPAFVAGPVVKAVNGAKDRLSSTTN